MSTFKIVWPIIYYMNIVPHAFQCFLQGIALQYCTIIMGAMECKYSYFHDNPKCRLIVLFILPANFLAFFITLSLPYFFITYSKPLR